MDEYFQEFSDNEDTEDKQVVEESKPEPVSEPTPIRLTKKGKPWKGFPNTPKQQQSLAKAREARARNLLIKHTKQTAFKKQLELAGRADIVQTSEIDELKQMIRDLTIKQAQQVEVVATPIKKEPVPMSQQFVSESESDAIPKPKLRRAKKEAVVFKKAVSRRKAPVVYEDTTETEMDSEPVMVRPKRSYRSKIEPTKHTSSTIVRDINDMF